MMDNKNNMTDLERRDRLDDILMRLSGMIGAVTYLMGDLKDNEGESFHIWLSDVRDRLEEAARLV